MHTLRVLLPVSAFTDTGYPALVNGHLISTHVPAESDVTFDAYYLFTLTMITAFPELLRELSLLKDLPFPCTCLGSEADLFSC